MNATERNGLRKVDAAVTKVTATVKEGRKAAEQLAAEAINKTQDDVTAAQDVTAAIVAQAGEALALVRGAAVDTTEAARETLVDVGDRLAAILQRATNITGDTTGGETGGDALTARVLGSVADGVSSVSRALRQRSVADLAADTKALARKHPGAFLAAAAVLGFAAARYVRASNQRRLAEPGGDAERRV